MKFKEFRHYFSSARINRYITATSNSSSRAIKLYKANLKISQCFHPLLGVLEVALRNRLSDVLSGFFSDPDWIINQKTGFMDAPSLTFIYKKNGLQKKNDFLLREVRKAEKRLRKTGTPITSGKIIAEQTFGFWTDLFEVYHYKLLKGKPIQVFATLPTGYGRKEICEELDKIRRFRNRINHNEPVCFSGTNIDFTTALEVYNSIIDIMTWIDPALIKFISNLDKVKITVDNAKKI
jgi:hypothetical protein